jgi:hypothetical protein
MEIGTETIQYFLMRRVPSGEPECIFARVTTPLGQIVDFICNSKRQWVPDTYNDLACQLLVMPDLGFRGEISAEKVVRLDFPLLTPEGIVEDPY